MISGGGVAAIRYSLKVASTVGLKKFKESVFSKNTCKTCAFGMGGQQGGMRNEEGIFPEICKKSIQAQITDIQPEIPPELFEKISIEEFNSYDGKKLERLGRLNYPLYKSKNNSHYSVLSWEDALQITAQRLRTVHPDRTFFYSSGRSSNESGFLLQLFARMFGSNNINSCSFYCHQASGVGLKSVIGTGTSTIQLNDLTGADCIFVIGANPASNHPRFIRELLKCRRRGGHVVVINPAKEPGLVRFAIPSDIKSILSGGSKIASAYVQPNIGGDIGFLKGLAKYVLSNKKEDSIFVKEYTHNFEEYKTDILSIDWNEYVKSSGVPRKEIERIGEIYSHAKNVVFTWAMGITHHTHGVKNVISIANLALLRGMIGRRYAGLAPIRGHSNVQGIGSVGFTPSLKEAVLKNLEKSLGINIKPGQGMDTMSCMHAAHKGNMDFAFMLGGNLYGSNPDQVYTSRALNRIAFKVFLNTTLNKGHFNGVDNEVVILPVTARDEEKQSTTQESMFNFVRLSDGGIVRLDNVRSEVDIIADIAAAVLSDSQVKFQQFKNHDTIRSAIASAIPGYGAIESIGKSKKEFHVEGRILHSPKFITPTGKAEFINVPIPEIESIGKNEFRMMTVRSEGQFNTVVYENEDVYRGQTDRRVVLMNKKDIENCGFIQNEKVSLESRSGIMENVTVREFDIAPGNVMTYFPESNVLVSSETDTLSQTPGFKNTLVKIQRTK